MTVKKKPRCPSCKSDSTEYIDIYKPLTKEDEKYFKNMDIYRCNICDLGFAHPVPEIEILDEYYSKVYRKPGRPHYISNPQNINFNEWQNAQYSYISQFFDIDKANIIMDIGPGYGFLLREIRRNHRNIRLIAVDPDTASLEYLKQYDIEVKKTLFDTEGDELDFLEKPDLILTSHSLEHMSDPRSFFIFVKKILSEEGKLFLEIPNCPLNENGYLHRPYDGPHLLFLTEKSLRYMVNDAGLKIEQITTAGKPYPDILEDMVNQYETFYEPNVITHNPNFRKIHKIITKRLKNTLTVLLKGNLNSSELTDYYPYQYGGNRWTLRAMIGKKE